MSQRATLTSLFVSIVVAFTAMACAKPLSVGDPAPLFELQTDTNTPFRLADRAGKWTILYFYPKDDTPGCTKQACAFRDSVAELERLGASVFGISKDSVASHQKFVSKYKLTFPLLADDKGRVMKAYGASSLFGLFAKRITFMIDPELKVQAVLKGLDPSAHAQEVSQVLLRLQQSPRP